MLHVAFSTVATPDWPLRRVAEASREWDFDGLELRTFGPGSTMLACDPCLSDPVKVRRALDDNGVSLTGVATSARFDEPLRPPPPAGFIFGDIERPVREFKPVVEHAARIGAPYVRVFGYELFEDESRKGAVRRIAERLKLVCDDARHQNVRIALENGGSFGRVEQLQEIMDRVQSPLLGISYSLSAGVLAGEDPAAAIDAAGRKLLCARLMDFQANVPCVIGQGDLPCEQFVRALDASNLEAPLVIEHPALWRKDASPAESVLPASFAAVTSWTGSVQMAGV
jgi:sugar phosphate isomerase/epimerase